jgi:hypothetical protein
MPAASIIRALIALMMEAASTSETLVNFYQTTRRNNPEDSHLQGFIKPHYKCFSTIMWNDSNQLEPLSLRFLRTAEAGPWRTFLERRMRPETGSRPKYFT